MTALAAPRTATLKRSPVALFAAVCLFLATGCQTNQQTGMVAGGAAGAGFGALIGNAVGGRTGAIIGGLLGAGAGAMIGGEIGRYLDEQDRAKATETTVMALEQSQANDGQAATSRWESDENPGVSGQTTAMGVGDNCYEAQEIATVPGEGEVRQTTRYCNQDGSWVAVA